MGDAVCLECECPIEASVEQRIGEGKRSCCCTKADLREALARAYSFISEQGGKLDLVGEGEPHPSSLMGAVERARKGDKS